MKNTMAVLNGFYMGLSLQDDIGFIWHMDQDFRLCCVLYDEHGYVHSTAHVPCDISSFVSWAESLSDDTLMPFLANAGLNSLSLDGKSEEEKESICRERRLNALNHISSDVASKIKSKESK